MNAHKLIFAGLAILLAASPAFAAPAPAAESDALPAAESPAAESPAADVFGVSLLSPAGDCQAKPQTAGTVDPTQKCGACSQDGCKLNWIGVECGSNPRGTKICVVTSTATCWPDGGAICRCQNPD